MSAKKAVIQYLEGQHSWVSPRMIAHDIPFCLSSVQRALREIRKGGQLHKRTVRGSNYYALPHSPASGRESDVPRKDGRTGNERFCIRLTREAAESYRQGPPTRYPPGIGCWPQYGCPEYQTCPIKAAGDCPLDAWNAKVEAGWTVDERSGEGEL